MIRSLLTLVFLTLMIGGCADLDFEKPKSDGAVGELSQKSFNVRARGLEQPDTFEVEVMTRNLPAKSWVIKRQAASTKSQRAFDVPSSALTADSEVTAGESYVYEIGYYEGSEFKVAGRREIKIPVDVVVSKAGLNLVPASTEPTEIKGARFFVESGGVLVTNGRALTIDVDEIRSSGGVVTTFTDEPAPLGKAGLSGGSLVIRAKKLIGDLSVIQRGQTGGRGLKGSTGSTGAVGSTGARIDAAQLGWYTHQSIPYWLARDPEWVNKHPGRGLRGGGGGPGGSGHPGLQGGGAGSLEIKIDEFNPSQLRISITPGRGGLGGEGGDGGNGGPGGPGGEITSNNQCHNSFGSCCPAPPPGPLGDSGQIGPVGPSGVSGEVGRGFLSGNQI